MFSLKSQVSGLYKKNLEIESYIIWYFGNCSLECYVMWWLQICKNTDYKRPMKPFFQRNSKLLGLGRQVGQINFGAFGIFSVDLSAPILIQWVPCPCFLLINHYLYKKLSLYSQIPILFGLQRIRVLAIVCP